MAIRITDAMLGNKYLSTMNKIKNNISKLNQDIATQQKIHAPSDSPSGIAKLLSLNKKISECDTYISNIDEGNSYLNATINAMEAMQNDTTNLTAMLTETRDSTKSDTLASYAEKIDTIIDSLISNANTEFQGKYLFGGTDYKSKPYALGAGRNSISELVNDLSGKSKVKITSNTDVAININGSELFSTIVSQAGNVDSSTAVGGTINSQATIYDGAGNQYTMNLTLTKTAVNSYDMTYSIDDSSPATIYTCPDTFSLAFDATDGTLKSVNGSSNLAINVSVPANNINLTFDMSNVVESASATSLSYSANQNRDIFSTLIAIRNNLDNGIIPTDDDVKIVQDFNNHLLDKLAQAGNVQNQLSNTKDMMDNRKLLLTNLASNENEVDVAKAVTDLQNQDYLLQLSYKVASMILPQSLLDYL